MPPVVLEATTLTRCRPKPSPLYGSGCSRRPSVSTAAWVSCAAAKARPASVRTEECVEYSEPAQSGLAAHALQHVSLVGAKVEYSRVPSDTAWPDE